MRVTLCVCMLICLVLAELGREHLIPKTGLQMIVSMTCEHGGSDLVLCKNECAKLLSHLSGPLNCFSKNIFASTTLILEQRFVWTPSSRWGNWVWERPKDSSEVTLTMRNEMCMCAFSPSTRQSMHGTRYLVTGMLQHRASLGHYGEIPRLFVGYHKGMATSSYH